MEKIFCQFLSLSVTLVLNANTSPVNKFSNYYVPFTFANEKYNLNNTLMEKIFCQFLSQRVSPSF